MNKRRRNKRTDPIQKAFDVIAEHLASTPYISFFINPVFGNDKDRFELHNADGLRIVSKPVEFAWRNVKIEGEI